MNRRDFLKLCGVTAAGAAAGLQVADSLGRAGFSEDEVPKVLRIAELDLEFQLISTRGEVLGSTQSLVSEGENGEILFRAVERTGTLERMDVFDVATGELLVSVSIRGNPCAIVCGSDVNVTDLSIELVDPPY